MSHNVHFSKSFQTVRPARYQLGQIGLVCQVEAIGLFTPTWIFFFAARSLQSLPSSLGPSCLFLFSMMTQNITNFAQFQYLAATLCRFLTLFIQKVD